MDLVKWKDVEDVKIATFPYRGQPYDVKGISVRWLSKFGDDGTGFLLLTFTRFHYNIKHACEQRPQVNKISSEEHTMKKKVAVSQIQDAMKTNLEKIYTLSLISGWNAVVVSPPGWGKTKMTFHMGNYAVNGSGGKSVFLPISPATPPERVTGPIDIIALKEGVLKNANVVDTPYDPTARVVILDEFGRASDAVFEQLIHATNDVTRPSSQRPRLLGNQ